MRLLCGLTNPHLALFRVPRIEQNTEQHLSVQRQAATFVLRLHAAYPVNVCKRVVYAIKVFIIYLPKFHYFLAKQLLKLSIKLPDDRTSYKVSAVC